MKDDFVHDCKEDCLSKFDNCDQDEKNLFGLTKKELRGSQPQRNSLPKVTAIGLNVELTQDENITANHPGALQATITSKLEKVHFCDKAQKEEEQAVENYKINSLKPSSKSDRHTNRHEDNKKGGRTKGRHRDKELTREGCKQEFRESYPKKKSTNTKRHGG